jgi:hypothetical protein
MTNHDPDVLLEGRQFIAMELLEGQILKQPVSGPRRTTLRISSRVAVRSGGKCRRQPRRSPPIPVVLDGAEGTI